MAETLFQLEGVAIGYRRPLISSLVLGIARGEFWGIFGPNGAGKTTFIKVLLGALKPLAGTVRRAPGLRLGYVPQLNSVRDSLPLTVRQVIELGALDLRNPPAATETLERVNLAHMAKERFSDLSGGQRQRVMIARALHRRPDVLILDEPTNGVDIPTRHTVTGLMARLHGEGVTLLLITHLLAEIGPEVSHFFWLDGRRDLCLAGPREEILKSPKLEEAYGAGLRIINVDGKPVLTWADNGQGNGEVQ